jgi:hypothetical protein
VETGVLDQLIWQPWRGFYAPISPWILLIVDLGLLVIMPLLQILGPSRGSRVVTMLEIEWVKIECGLALPFWVSEERMWWEKWKCSQSLSWELIKKILIHFRVYSWLSIGMKPEEA